MAPWSLRDSAEGPDPPSATPASVWCLRFSSESQFPLSADPRPKSLPAKPIIRRQHINQQIFPQFNKWPECYELPVKTQVGIRTWKAKMIFHKRLRVFSLCPSTMSLESMVEPENKDTSSDAGWILKKKMFVSALHSYLLTNNNNWRIDSENTC